MSAPTALQIATSDRVVDTLNSLRTGVVPQDVVALLTEMVGNFNENGTVATLPGRMRRQSAKAAVAQALMLAANCNKPLGSAPNALTKSAPLARTAQDMAAHLAAVSSHVLDATTAMGIASRHLASHQGTLLGLSVVFTSETCVQQCAGSSAEHAKHIVGALLVDDTSPQHKNRDKVFDQRYTHVSHTPHTSTLFVFFC